MEGQKEFVTLSNICEGKMEEEFQEKYSHIMDRILPGETGTISVKMKITRLDNTITMAQIEYTMGSATPARKRSCIAEISDGLLKVDPARPCNVRQLKLTGQGE